MKRTVKLEEGRSKGVSRRDLLKSMGLFTAGAAALSLGGARPASATEPTSSHAYVHGYVGTASLGIFFVQAGSLNHEVPNVGTGAVQTLTTPGRGFDFDPGAPVVLNNSAKNKGRNPSWCLLKLTKGGLTHIPPVNDGGKDAIRFEGEVEDSADPSLVGVPVKVSASSGLAVDGHHPICTIKFDFGGTLLTGRGLAFVNL